MHVRVRGLWKDVGLFALVFAHWTVVSAIVDMSTNDVQARRGVAIWIFVFAAIINGTSLTRSWMFWGSGNGPPETTVGLFFEIVNLSQLWGSMYVVACYFSHDAKIDDLSIFNRTLLELEFESFVEMSFVSAGVGFVSLFPETVLDKVVAWLAAYVGGILCVNMFLLSIVMSRQEVLWDRRGVYDSVATAVAPRKALSFHISPPTKCVSVTRY